MAPGTLGLRVSAAPDAVLLPVSAPVTDAAPLPPRLRLVTLALPGVRSLRRNAPAIVGLQLAGLAVVVGYYTSPAVRAFATTWPASKPPAAPPRRRA